MAGDFALFQVDSHAGVGVVMYDALHLPATPAGRPQVARVALVVVENLLKVWLVIHS
jgi:hypothetical protein